MTTPRPIATIRPFTEGWSPEAIAKLDRDFAEKRTDLQPMIDSLNRAALASEAERQQKSKPDEPQAPAEPA